MTRTAVESISIIAETLGLGKPKFETFVAVRRNFIFVKERSRSTVIS